MRDEGFWAFVCGVVFGIIGGVIGASAALSNSWTKESVATGHAEYVLDGDRAVWRWKEIFKDNQK